LLTEAHHQIANLLRAIPPPVDPQLTEGGLLGALRQMVDRELAPAFDEVVWQITPEAEQATRGIPTFSAEVLIYAVREVIRNAARHARTEEPGHVLRLCLSIRWKNGLVIDIEDNGAGIASPAPAGGGSGQGLALHSTMLAVVGGMLSSQSVRGAYTRVSLVLPEASLSEPAMMAAEP
jgi:signal transduction histidine kinase